MEIDRTGWTVTETRTVYGFAGVAVAVRTHEAAATVFLFQNHLGSTVAGFDDTSNSHIKQYYYPYGAERGSVGSLPVDQRYTGQTSDATGAASGDTGLLYYQARYYDPTVGAFAAADTVVPTVGLSVGLNRYAYVAGNPTNFSDPTGHCVWIPFSGSMGCPGGGIVNAIGRGLKAGGKWLAGATVKSAKGVWSAGEAAWNVVSQLDEFFGDRIGDEIQDLLIDGDYGELGWGHDTLELALLPVELVVDTVGFVAGTATGGTVDQTNCPPSATCIEGSSFPRLFGFKGQTFRRGDDLHPRGR
jgi:RHS repeat-associated protein